MSQLFARREMSTKHPLKMSVPIDGLPIRPVTPRMPAFIAVPLSRWVLLATLLLCLLPCVCGGSVMVALTELIEPLSAAQSLGDKNLAYWLLTLAGIAIASWTWIFKWLINQLELQRKAHAEAVSKLIEFMTQDHTATTAMLSSSQAALIANSSLMAALRKG